MPNFTPNLNLKKPLTTEYYNIADFNDNMDILDGALEIASQAEAEAGTDNQKAMTALRVKQSIEANERSPITGSVATTGPGTFNFNLPISATSVLVYRKATSASYVSSIVLARQGDSGLQMVFGASSSSEIRVSLSGITLTIFQGSNITAAETFHYVAFY